MADIIYAQPQQQSGLGISLGDILPIAALGALALGAYWLYTQMSQGNGTPSQGTNTGPGLGPVTGNAQSQQSPGGQAVAEKQDTSYLQSLTALFSRLSGTQAVYANYGGVPSVNVSSGRDTPTNFFPGGNNVVVYSQQPTNQMIQETMQNLVSSQATQNITNAWWQPATTTAAIGSGWVQNSQGNPQTASPGERKHCACTAALKAAGVCGPNDDWYYC